MTPLPIDSYLPEIVRRLGEARSLVIVAEPGAGKTTRVPPAVLGSGVLSPQSPNLIMLQPRRVAARASAMRIAEENRWDIGGEIGYQIRFENKIGPKTRLRILTEGILTRRLLDDPFLEGVGVVILDEFHERSLNVDLAIAMLREVQKSVRQDLMIVVMSATLDAEPAAKFLGDCPVIHVPGRTFGVEIEYHPHASAPVVSRAAEAVEEICGREDSAGDVLVFLPGAEEIRRTISRLEGLADRLGLDLLPLYASLPAEAQMRALAPSRRRKIILATNIAETSLTIDGVRWVVDSGLARVPAFDPHRGLDRLELKRISKASATQRAGRAGRTAPGRCLRLWSAKEQAALEDFELPEIKRVDLCGAVLDLHAWGKPVAAEFGWFEAPGAPALGAAERLLELLGALKEGRITEVGKKLNSLPLHPRIGRLLCAAAELGCADEGAVLAALLSEKDIRLAEAGPRYLRSPSARGDSDLLARMDNFFEAENQHFAGHLRDRGIDPMAARQVGRIRQELQRLGRRLAGTRRNPSTRETLLKLLLLAYPDRVCRRRSGDRSSGIMTGGSGVRLDPASIVLDAEIFLALDARDDPRAANREAVVRIASAVEFAWLRELFSEFVSREREAEFDEGRQRVVGRTVVRYRDLVLSEESDSAVDPKLAGKTLAEAMKSRVGEIFGEERVANLIYRVKLLREAMPEHPWPGFDERDLGEILEEACAGKTKVEEITPPLLIAGLESRLGYPLDQLLRAHAPEEMEVPSGSRIGLQYRDGHPPILAVRLQEIFGWRETPRIAGGRVAVLLHLLGPNFRPVQITGDLKSFWGTTYFQVRKDLRVKYPKHSWPDDPLSAPAVAKGRARRKT